VCWAIAAPRFAPPLLPLLPHVLRLLLLLHFVLHLALLLHLMLLLLLQLRLLAILLLLLLLLILLCCGFLCSLLLQQRAARLGSTHSAQTTTIKTPLASPKRTSIRAIPPRIARSSRAITTASQQLHSLQVPSECL
jgi:hypothetical protein